MEHDIPPDGGTNVPVDDNQVTTGNPVAPKHQEFFGPLEFGGLITYVVICIRMSGEAVRFRVPGIGTGFLPPWK